jgi:hypothetical protein
MGNNRTVLLSAALVFCAALGAHAPELSASLLWDDAQFIGDNSFAASCSNMGAALNPVHLIKVLPAPFSARPLVNVSLIADACSAAGPYGMRLTSLLFHAFNSALLFFLLLALSASVPASLFGALVLAVHPAAAEAVNIISFRSHLLGFFFFISALFFSLVNGRKAALPLAAAAAGCYFLALMSVETAFVLPAAALLTVYFDSGKDGLKRTGPLFAALALVAVFYLWFRVPRSGYDIPGVSTPGISAASFLYPASIFPKGFAAPDHILTMPAWRAVYSDTAANLFTMARVTLDYASALVLPLGLSPDYSPRVITTLRQGFAPLAGCLLFLAGVFSLYLRKRLAGLGLLLTFTCLLPALNLWPIYNIRADRYLYLPLAGFCLACAAGFKYCLAGGRKRRVLAALALLWVSALSAITLRRAPEFRNDLALFSAAVKQEPAAARARANLAAAWLRAGNCREAAAEAAQAAALDPANPQLRLRLAFTLASCGRGGEALKEADEALRVSPGNAAALYLSGLLRLNIDRRGAIDRLRQADAAAPASREAFLTLFLVEKKDPAALGPRDREALSRLKKFYSGAGLLF